MNKKHFAPVIFGIAILALFGFSSAVTVYAATADTQATQKQSFLQDYVDVQTKQGDVANLQTKQAAKGVSFWSALANIQTETAKGVTAQEQAADNNASVAKADTTTSKAASSTSTWHQFAADYTDVELSSSRAAAASAGE